jgi:hypothetical protein
MLATERTNGTCGPSHGLERVRYFPRQLLTADDMAAEQQYFRQKLRRHNRFLHGWGVVCGCAVEPNPDADHPWQVRICPGYLITPQGDEVVIEESVDFDLAGDWRQASDPCGQPSPCPPRGRAPSAEGPQSVYLAVCHAECDSRPVRVHPMGCACDEAACEYSRVRDSFEVVRLMKLPESHRLAAEADRLWYASFKQWVSTGGKETLLPPPLPGCPPCPDEPCVVLAKIELPKATPGPTTGDPTPAKITYEGRRVLFSTTSLQVTMWPPPGP